MGRIQLFCIPYAGGSAAVYHAWKKDLHPSIELIPLELSGRGKRISEKLYESMDEIVEDLFPTICEALDGKKTYALFGHSLGSLIVYELARKINGSGLSAPEHLFLSGKSAPHKKIEKKNLHLLDDQTFMEEIYHLGGTPKEVLEHRELMSLMIPVLKKDYRIAEIYSLPKENIMLESNMSILYGTEDDMNKEEVKAWTELTTGRGEIYPFSGGHFFIKEHMEEIIQIVNRTLISANVQI